MDVPPVGTRVDVEVGTDATRLYVALARIARAVRRDAPVSPIGPGAHSTLTTLVKEGPQRLGALTATEGVSPPSMTRIVASLEDQGLVRRTADPDDGRASLVSATEAGTTLVETGKGERLAALGVRIERLEAPERAALVAALPALESLARE